MKKNARNNKLPGDYELQLIERSTIMEREENSAIPCKYKYPAKYLSVNAIKSHKVDIGSLAGKS